MSLDGYIAEPNGEADWVIMDPDFGFRALAGLGSKPGKDTWLFRSLLEAWLVDAVEGSALSERFELKLASGRVFNHE